MLKKILIGVGIVIVLLVIAFIYLNNRNRTLSPPGSTSLENAGIAVSVDYSRPSVRDRLIFGEAEEGALQPFGVYWRLGANEPTQLEVNADFTFDGQDVKAGRYTVYAIPRKGEMEMRLNSKIPMWGYSEPDYSLDILTAIIRTSQGEKVEQFTISTAAIEGGVELLFEWDTYKWSVPILKR